MAEIARIEINDSLLNVLLTVRKAAPGYALRSFARTGLKADNSFATEPDKSICSRQRRQRRRELLSTRAHSPLDIQPARSPSPDPQQRARFASRAIAVAG